MKSAKKSFIRLLLACSCLFVFFGATQAQSPAVESFYRGKTISLIIGVSAGGGYDLYARTLAKYLGSYIPGKPTVVPQNMPGAGSLNAIAYLASAAPRDGTAMATFARGMPLYPLMFKASFDGSKLKYVGSVTTDDSVCITWKTSRIKT